MTTSLPKMTKKIIIIGSGFSSISAATYLADKVICFDGTPAKECNCTAPESLITGMNKFLRLMDISFRRDPSNYRPRINKDQS